MLNKMNFIFIFLIAWVTGCSSINLEVVSDPPDATVFLYENDIPKPLGKTPLIITDETLSKISGGISLLVAKDGFQKQKFLMEKRSFPVEGKIKVKLDPVSQLNTSDSVTNASWKEQVRKVASQVSKIQSALLKRDFPQAEVLSKTLLNEHPNLAVAWNLLGNNYYLQGKFNEAQGAYQKALLIEPDNVETQSILQKVRAPSGGSN